MFKASFSILWIMKQVEGQTWYKLVRLGQHSKSNRNGWDNCCESQIAPCIYSENAMCTKKFVYYKTQSKTLTILCPKVEVVV